MVVTKQDNAMERLQTMLAESLVKSHRIEQEQEKKSALRHNKQMEEIRNRHVREAARYALRYALPSHQ